MPDKKPRGRPTILPWEKWMDGKLWYLTRGVDFDAKLDSFTSHLHRTAASHGKIVTTKKVTYPKEAILIRFADKETT